MNKIATGLLSLLNGNLFIKNRVLVNKHLNTFTNVEWENSKVRKFSRAIHSNHCHQHSLHHHRHNQYQKHIRLSTCNPFSLADCMRSNYSTNVGADKNQTNYKIVELGEANTSEYRVFIRNELTNQLVSPFHDIPLFNDKDKSIFNMIVEIPRYTNAKMEINKKETLNPICQDIKKNKLRFVNNIFPYYGYLWNYGAFPQTYEDPNQLDKLTNFKGDNDPLDVCEIGTSIQKRGSVIGVKVLGALGLIDEGETDWKIIVIDQNDKLANELNSISDVEKKLPDLLNLTRDWFKIYKIPTGKPANVFALDGKYLDRDSAIEIIEHAHKSWSNLFDKTNDDEQKQNKTISLTNTTLTNQTSSKITSEQANEIFNKYKEQSSIIKKTNNNLDKLDFDEIERTFYINRNNI